MKVKKFLVMFISFSIAFSLLLISPGIATTQPSYEVIDYILGNPGERLGIIVDNIGDFNDDDYDDLLVSSILSDNKGRVDIYFGGPDFDHTPDITKIGEAPSDQFGGRGTWGVGDVNDDGYDDVLISAHSHDGKGKSYLLLGGDPPDSDYDWVYEPPVAFVFGIDAMGGGDLNNDGIDDIVIGQYHPDQISVFFGSLNDGNGNVTISNIPDVIITSPSGGHERFGISISGDVDVNSDGIDDLIVGAYYANGWKGAAYIYFGSSVFAPTIPDVIMQNPDPAHGKEFGAVVLGVGDLDGNDVDDVEVCYPHYTNPEFHQGMACIYLDIQPGTEYPDLEIEGSYEECFGWGYRIGDINKDDYDDLSIASTLSPSKTYTGRVYIYYGQDDFENNYLNGSFYLEGENNGDRFGSSVTSIDIDGDKNIELVIGATGYSSNSGKVYIYGIPSGLVTGGGWFIPEDSLKKVTFGFAVKYTKDGEIKGNLEIIDLDTSNNYRALSIDQLVIEGNSASFAGIVEVNGEGNYPFDAELEDNGSPGKDNDMFYIDMLVEGEHIIFDEVIDSGNIVIHK